MAASGERPLQDVAGDGACGEVLLDERARQAALAVVVGRDGLEAAHGLREIAEAQQPGVLGQDGARARVLNDRGPAAREVAERPIADPGVLELHAGWFDAAEFAARG